MLSFPHTIQRRRYSTYSLPFSSQFSSYSHNILFKIVYLVMTYINVFGHWIGWFISELIASNKWFDVTEDLAYLFSIIHAFRSIRTPTLSQLAISVADSYGYSASCHSWLPYHSWGSDWRFDALIKNRSYNLFGWTSGGTWCVLNGFCLWVVAGNNRTIDGPLSLTTIGGIITFSAV